VILNWLKAVVVFIIVVSLLGSIFTGGQAQSAFQQLFVMGAVFILVVEFVPQLIVGEEGKAARDD
jgi:ABC-type branched-subunit amino acid transport system permease subunit